jgi:hypothetical protein
MRGMRPVRVGIAGACAALLSLGAAGGASAATVPVTGDITSDTSWGPGDVYVLKTQVQVRNATLTIAPGTLILGDRAGQLIVAPDARIDARGTAEAPIVFSALAGPQPGGWRGLTLLGRAPINTNVNATPPSNQATLDQVAPAVAPSYGGTDGLHDCGVLRNVHIEFGGEIYVADRKAPGLGLYGCGSRTTIDRVQVHGSNGDGVAIFGGTVDLRRVLTSQTGDDGLDWTDGWRGRAQFLILKQSPGTQAEPSVAIEGDNHAIPSSYDALPRSEPTIWNATLVGIPDTGQGVRGMVLRRGTAGHLENLVVSTFPTFGVEFRDASTKAQLDGGALTIRHALVFDAPLLPPQASNDIDEASYVAAPAASNVFGVDPQLTAPQATAPNFAPKAGSPALTGGATPPNDGFFDPTATYRGAIGAADWTVGFASYGSSTTRAPTLNTAPAITGTARTGEALSCAPAVWFGFPDPSVTVQWLRDGAPIPGATSGQYVVAAADAGRAIGCRSTASNGAGTASADAPPVTVGAAPVGAGTPPPAAPAAPAAPAVPAAVADAVLRQALTASCRRERGRTLARRGRCATPFAAPSAGTILVTWTAIGRRATVLARGRTMATGAGRVVVPVRFTAAGKRLLRRGTGRLRIRVSAVFTDAAGVEHRARLTVVKRP